MVRRLVWTSGILAGIAALVPGSVHVGLRLGILPGLILAVAPTIFLYGVCLVLLRRWRPFHSGVVANVLALATVAVVGLAAAAPFAISGRRAFDDATQTDITPPSPIAIAGHVRLVREDLSSPSARRSACDHLCAALLETPGVLSVSLMGGGKGHETISYRLVSKRDAPSNGLTPYQPERILEHLPRQETGNGRRDARADFAAAEAARNTIRASWALRLATEQTLVTGPPSTNPDVSIEMTSLREAGFHRVARSEIALRDAAGSVLLRRQRVTAQPIAMPLHLVPEGPMLDRGFGLGRSFLHTGLRYGGIKPIEALYEDTKLARPDTALGAVVALRAAVAAVVAGDEKVDPILLTGWLATLSWAGLAEDDIDLLAELIANPRVPGLERIYDGYEKAVSPRLRLPIARRMLDRSTPADLRRRLDRLVRRMPPGTFERPLWEEVSLLQDRELRLHSSAYVGRLADSGPAAVPILIRLLEEDARIEPWAKRQYMMADIRRALSRLGPAAAEALPVVERFMISGRNPLTNAWRDAQNWRVAMVRMGKPVEDLSFPANSRPETTARDREMIRKQAAKEPTDDD